MSAISHYIGWTIENFIIYLLFFCAGLISYISLDIRGLEGLLGHVQQRPFVF